MGYNKDIMQSKLDEAKGMINVLAKENTDLKDFITLSSEMFKPLLPVCPAKAKKMLAKATERIKHLKGKLQKENEELNIRVETILEKNGQILKELILKNKALEEITCGVHLGDCGYGCIAKRALNKGVAK